MQALESLHCGKKFPDQGRYLHERLQHFERLLALHSNSAASNAPSQASGKRLNSKSKKSTFMSLLCEPPYWHLKLRLDAPGNGALYATAEYRGDARQGHFRHVASNVFNQFRDIAESPHASALHRAVNTLPNSTLNMFISINDWTVTQEQGNRAFLPLGEMCSVPAATGGIPVPDWTWYLYPGIKAEKEGAANSSWVEMMRVLQVEAASADRRRPLVSWRGRKTQPVFWSQMPIEHRVRRSLVVGKFDNISSSLKRLGLQNDVLLTGSSPPHPTPCLNPPLANPPCPITPIPTQPIQSHPTSPPSHPTPPRPTSISEGRMLRGSFLSWKELCRSAFQVLE